MARPAPAGSPERYKLSFTVGGLYLQSAPIATRLYLEEGDWTEVRRSLNANNLLQARTSSSAKRLSVELVQRLQMLNRAELDMIADGTADERGQLLWVAACRRYTLIREFAVEVLRERFLLMAQDLAYVHFDAFIRGKAIWHPELAALKESTLRKLRTTLFLMMREADLVKIDGLIVPTVLSMRIHDELAKREPSDLSLFATREVR